MIHVKLVKACLLLTLWRYRVEGRLIALLFAQTCILFYFYNLPMLELLRYSFFMRICLYYRYHALTSAVLLLNSSMLLDLLRRVTKRLYTRLGPGTRKTIRVRLVSQKCLSLNRAELCNMFFFVLQTFNIRSAECFILYSLLSGLFWERFSEKFWLSCTLLVLNRAIVVDLQLRRKKRQSELWQKK